MNIKLFHNIVRITSICCTILLFIAILHAPREYYWLLRIIVFIGATLVIIKNIAKAYWVVVFGIVLILFNPIYPIYLYKKVLWIPIDILSALLFLIEIIINKSKKSKPITTKKEIKKYERDRIY